MRSYFDPRKESVKSFVERAFCHYGNHSANSLANRLRAGFQSRMGIVHFAVMLRMEREKNNHIRGAFVHEYILFSVSASPSMCITSLLICCKAIWMEKNR